MQKLRELIENHSRWETYIDMVDRIEGHRTSDFSVALENAKALLESIAKEICDARQKKPTTNNITMNLLLKNAFVALGYTKSDMVTRISSALATIAQQIGELRNEIGSTSHGHTVDEHRSRNDRVDALTRDFLLDSTSTVAIFLIRAFEEQEAGRATASDLSKAPTPIEYNDCNEFNTWLDGQFKAFQMGDYSWPASFVFFHVDSALYHSAREQYETEQGAIETEENGQIGRERD